VTKQRLTILGHSDFNSGTCVVSRQHPASHSRRSTQQAPPRSVVGASDNAPKQPQHDSERNIALELNASRAQTPHAGTL